MNEEEIRKREVFDRYLEMVREDSAVYFSDRREFVEIPCQACGTRDYSFQFTKAGFDYVLCNVCSTLFVNPRPKAEVLARFYVDSPSTSFWVNEFFKPVAETRREKIFRPRAEYLTRKYADGQAWVIGDIGSGFGLFLEELSKLWEKARLIAIEPSREMSEICRSKGFEVLPCALEEVGGRNEKFDLLTSFELFEHVFEPQTFLGKAWELLRPEGRLFLTTLNGNGFDIQVLWERSKSVAPPHHLNFFNPRSITMLLEKTGFIIEEIATPGELDWDIVEGMMRNEGIDAGRFYKFLASEGTVRCKKEFQEWIARNNLSSHMRVVAKKRKDHS